MLPVETTLYWLRIAISVYPAAAFPSVYCHDVWYEKKTRMVWLPDGEKTLKMFVSINCTNMTNERTNRHGIVRACIAPRGKESQKCYISPI